MSYEIFEKLCEQHGVTAYKVCKDTGVAKSTVSSWKLGQYEPKADKRRLIAEYFGVSLEYLDTGIEPGEPDFDPEIAQITQQLKDRPELKALLRAGKNATTEDIEAVVRLLSR